MTKNLFLSVFTCFYLFFFRPPKAIKAFGFSFAYARFSCRPHYFPSFSFTFSPTTIILPGE